MNIAVIGGGAAGFFSAIHAKERYPESHVVIFEKSNKVLAKVRISGGGRCNVTNACSSIDALCMAYPRGGKQLRKAFNRFNTSHTRAWFESRGVALTTEADQRVFPRSNSSQSIIDCLINETKKLDISIALKTPVKGINPTGNQLELHLSDAPRSTTFDKVIVATGGSPRIQGLRWLEHLGHHVEAPVPSLFTFNMPEEGITSLMGVSVPHVKASIQGSRLQAEGALLITHWGMSGPAILKLSAFGARLLHEMEYQFKVRVNWASENNNEVVSDELQYLAEEHPKKIMTSVRPFALPKQLWSFLLDRGGIPTHKRWSELGKKGVNKLVNLLTNDVYTVTGTTTFKEEFVTCGVSA